MAIIRGYLPIVDFLIQNSGASDKRNRYGSTPLHYCAYYGRTEPAKLLLRAGVDLQVQDNENHTALDVAKIRENKAVEELVRFLVFGLFASWSLDTLKDYLKFTLSHFSCYMPWKGRKHCLKTWISTGTWVLKTLPTSRMMNPPC